MPCDPRGATRCTRLPHWRAVHRRPGCSALDTGRLGAVLTHPGKAASGIPPASTLDRVLLPVPQGRPSEISAGNRGLRVRRSPDLVVSPAWTAGRQYAATPRIPSRQTEVDRGHHPGDHARGRLEALA